MYQGRLWLFRGNKRRIILFFVLALFNTCFLYSQNNDKIKLNNLNITAEELKKAFNPAKSKFDSKGITTIIIDPGHGGRDPGSIGVGKKMTKLYLFHISFQHQ